MSLCLNREAVLSANDITVERCDVPEWGGHVFVKTMSARAKEQWENERLNERGEDEKMNMGNVRASLAASTMCDESGTLLFTQKDVNALNDKSILALDRVFDKARKLNRIGTQDMDDLVKNSSATPDADLPSV